VIEQVYRMIGAGLPLTHINLLSIERPKQADQRRAEQALPP